jgi:hypothetical protein
MADTVLLVYNLIFSKIPLYGGGNCVSDQFKLTQGNQQDWLLF